MTICKVTVELQSFVHKVAEIEQKQKDLELDTKEGLNELVISLDQRYQKFLAQSNTRVSNLEQSVQNLTKVHGALLKMTNVSSYKHRQYSSRKFCFPVGYNIYLNVCFNEGHQYLSCYICVTDGIYNNTLEWPLYGEIVIELLNQLEDSNHKGASLVFNEATVAGLNVAKPAKTLDTTGFGIPKFMSQKNLGYNNNNCQYLKHNALYFRVTVHHKLVSMNLGLFIEL